MKTSAPQRVDAYRSTGTSPGRRPYEIVGPRHAPPIVVLGGISADRHVTASPAAPEPGWWPGVAGPGAVLDPHHFRLIGMDYLGGPERPLGPGRPVSTPGQARALVNVLDEAGIERVALVGASYGGMVALAFAAAYPSRADRLVLLGAAHRTHPMATAWRAIQRSIVRLAAEGGRADAGLALARALAMTTYRSAQEFEARFSSVPEPTDATLRFPVEAYLEANGERFASRFDARAFLTLSASIDAHRTEPDSVEVPTTLVSFDSDALVPPWLVQELDDALGVRSEHVRLSSVYGHDAFLKEVTAVSEVIGDALAPLGACSGRPGPAAASPREGVR